MIYTYEEAFKSSLEYFNGDELAANIWIGKYCLKNDKGELLEKSPTDMHKRIAKELARIEQKYQNPLSEQEIFELIDKFKYIVPQGSPMAGIGNNQQITSISNCFVIHNGSDSYGGIMQIDQEQAQIMKRRGGAGTDLSHIRPKGSPVKNSALTSTGVVPFMERYSNTTREVAQDGRRGALLISISIKHPDVVDFIDAKLEQGKITGANISVKMTTDFLYSVIADDDYLLRFPIDLNVDTIISSEYDYNKLYAINNGYIKKVKAKEIWKKLMYNAWKSAEPGIIFWDKIIRESSADCYKEEGFNTVTCNPCIPGWSKLMTKSGIKQLNDINVGEQIWSREGWTTIINKWSNGIKDVYKYSLQFDDKIPNTDLEYAFYGTKNHQIVSYDKKIEVCNATDIDCFLNNINDDFSCNFTDKLSIEPLMIKSSELYSTEEVFDITVDNKSHTFWCQGCNISNCGEIFLNSYGACNLIAMNFYSYIDNPFSIAARFNYELFKKNAIIIQRLADDMLDIELEKIDAIINKIYQDPEPIAIKEVEINLWTKIANIIKQGRRTGCGFTALGDTIAALGLKYGTKEATEFAAELQKIYATQCYKSSIILAKERGSFPIWNYDKEINNDFIQRITKELVINDYKQYGRRNICCNTVSPTGTVSQMTQTSGGIEPIFQIAYTRRKKINPSDKNARIDFIDETGEKWQEFNVLHSKLIDWYFINGERKFHDYNACKRFLEALDKKTLDDIIKKSPYFGATANDIDAIEKIKMQGQIQLYVDQSISVTCNLPKETTIEQIDELYLTAWKEGCKGCTVYRDGSRSGVLIDKKESEQNKLHNKRNGYIVINSAPKRPKSIPCDIHYVTSKGTRWMVLVGKLYDAPYEVFAFKKSHVSLSEKINKGNLIKIRKGGIYNLDISGIALIENINELFDTGGEEALTRMTALALRHGADVKFAYEQLDKSKDDIVSFGKAIARVLKTYIKDDDIPSNSKCPNCGAADGLHYTEGCVKCKYCEYGKC